jgi:hypothetical protein
MTGPPTCRGSCRRSARSCRPSTPVAVPASRSDAEVVGRDGGYSLRFRSPLAVEDWNAQLLLTGRAAAEMMFEAGVGIVRTMPPADEYDVARLRRGRRPGHRLAGRPSLRRCCTRSTLRSDAGRVPQEAAVLFRRPTWRSTAATSDPMHGTAARYATAPRPCAARRPLCERCASRRVPDRRAQWARDASPALPIEMALGAEARNRRANGGGCGRGCRWRRWSDRNRTGW